MKLKVLVTGSAGFIGQAVVAAMLQHGFAVRGLDRQATPGLNDAIVGRITDAAMVDQALTGVDAVVHLAATPDRARFVEQLVPPNVVGLYRVLDGARRLGVGRVVLASTIRVGSGKLDQGAPVGPDEAAPMDHYALTKLWAEQAGAMYARQGWIDSVIAARIGWLPRTAEDEHRLHHRPEAYAAYLSRGDAGRFFIAAVEARHQGFNVLYALGPDGSKRADLQPSRDVIGYTPQDIWPSGAIAESRWRGEGPRSDRI